MHVSKHARASYAEGGLARFEQWIKGQQGVACVLASCLSLWEIFCFSFIFLFFLGDKGGNG